MAHWLAWLEQLHPTEIDLGLHRIRAVYQRLQITPTPAKVLSIAGTNGKGTCARAAEALALDIELKVGCYTSPHLWRYNERIRINGQAVTDEEIVAAFHAIDCARQSTSLSYFEFGTLAALWLFAESQLDLWILEVGLGGRLDAVNIVDCDAAVVTAIGLDHQAWLGDDLNRIAEEKAAICRPERPLLLGPQVPDSARVLAQSVGASVCRIEADQIMRDQVLAMHSGLVADNLQLAVSAIDSLGWPLEQARIAQAVAQLKIPGRCQKRDYASYEEIVDVAHNLQSVQHLDGFLQSLAPRAPTAAVFSALIDKPVQAMVDAIAPHIDFWCIAPLNVARGLDLPDLRAAFTAQTDVREFASIAAARAYAAQHAQRLVTFGSFHTVEQAGQ